eukprot:TRINITY_DN21027_c0_g2_i1.p1 TRINITY_DN21027_c0_g2~~TRINITY_DN21027_c0_g2_i1.p1  ORF type:complete len:408 (-),score=26.64 TRINITY_DN21027_c0_g2_i1:157-1380(-)
MDSKREMHVSVCGDAEQTPKKACDVGPTFRTQVLPRLLGNTAAEVGGADLDSEASLRMTATTPSELTLMTGALILILWLLHGASTFATVGLDLPYGVNTPFDLFALRIWLALAVTAADETLPRKAFIWLLASAPFAMAWAANANYHFQYELQPSHQMQLIFQYTVSKTSLFLFFTGYFVLGTCAWRHVQEPKLRKQQFFARWLGWTVIAAYYLTETLDGTIRTTMQCNAYCDRLSGGRECGCQLCGICAHEPLGCDGRSCLETSRGLGLTNLTSEMLPLSLQAGRCASATLRWFQAIAVQIGCAQAEIGSEVVFHLRLVGVTTILEFRVTPSETFALVLSVCMSINGLFLLKVSHTDYTSALTARLFDLYSLLGAALFSITLWLVASVPYIGADEGKRRSSVSNLRL